MIEKLKKKNISFIENASLKNYNTFKVMCVCKCLIEPKSIEELLYVIKLLKENDYKYLLLGNGSNVIFKNERIDYFVIKLTDIKDIIIENNTVLASCGVLMPVLVNKYLEHGLIGLEWASGIPGTVGACTYNNAGAYGGETFDNIVKIIVLDKEGNVKSLLKEDLTYGYRTSYFKENKEYIILQVLFKLDTGNVEEAKVLIKERLEKRKNSQPLEFPSAGSVFRNPENNYAGALIESSGLKGFSVGDAFVSEKHANFIVNKGNATGKDIVSLIEIIKERIKKDHNIDLILEQEIID